MRCGSNWNGPLKERSLWHCRSYHRSCDWPGWTAGRNGLLPWCWPIPLSTGTAPSSTFLSSPANLWQMTRSVLMDIKFDVSVRRELPPDSRFLLALDVFSVSTLRRRDSAFSSLWRRRFSVQSKREEQLESIERMFWTDVLNGCFERKFSSGTSFDELSALLGQISRDVVFVVDELLETDER